MDHILVLVTIGLGISAYGRNSTALYLALAFLVVLYVAAIVLQERMVTSHLVASDSYLWYF